MMDRIKNRALGLLIILLIADALVLFLALKPGFQQEEVTLDPETFLMDMGRGEFKKGIYVDHGYEGAHRIVTEPLWLRRGFYTITATHDTNNGTVPKGEGYGCWLVAAADHQKADGYDAAQIESDRIEFMQGSGTTTFTVHVKQAGEYRIVAALGDASQETYLLLTGLNLKYLRRRSLINGFASVAFPLLFINLISAAWILRKEQCRAFVRDHSVGATGIVAIVFLACYPCMDWNLFFEGDMWYHFNRIRFLAEGLASGSFPVRIHPGWNNGYGYAVGVFYADMFLMPSAIMLLLGYTMNAAYKFHIIMVTAITAAGSYYAAKKISGDRIIALVCSGVFTLSLKRIMLIFPSNMVGQYDAVSFLPMLMAGLYGIYSKKKELSYRILLGIGITGILQSHVITVLMSIIAVGLFALLMWRTTIEKDVLLSLLKTLGAVIWGNLFFLVPFFDYYINQPIRETTIEEPLWEWAVDPMELLVRNRLNALDGTPIGVIPFLVMFLGAALLLSGRMQEESRVTLVSMICAGVFLWMGSAFFPWYTMHWRLGGLEGIMRNVEFPGRFHIYVDGFLFIVLLLTLCSLKKAVSASAMYAVGCVLCVLCLTQILDYYSDLHTEGHRIEVYDTDAKMAGMTLGDSFIIPGSEKHSTSVREVQEVKEGTIALSGFERKGTTQSVYAVNTSDRAQDVLFPLWAYRGYVAYAGNERLIVKEAEDHRVRVSIPAGYSGEIRVHFREPFLWRLSELLSVVFLIVMLRKWIRYCRSRVLA